MCVYEYSLYVSYIHVNIEKVYKNIDFKYTIYVCMNIDLCVHKFRLYVSYK